MQNLDCEYLITHQGDKIQCEIRDKPTGKIYVDHRAPMGTPHDQLVEDALELAVAADKPLTAAQAMNESNSILANENARLKAEIEQLRGNMPQESSASSASGKGRRRNTESASSPE